MRQSTLRLLVPASAVYILFLFFLRSLIPEKITPSVALLAFPLIILAAIFISDLSTRAVAPTTDQVRNKPPRNKTREVQYLTRQLEVATKASPTYFDSAILGRLREALTDKVNLETGMDKESIRRLLTNPEQGPRLLGDVQLYRLLFYPPPRRAQERLPMLREIIDRIEGWKA